MPTLDWIGKKKVVNHHLDVPFRVLEKKYTYSADNKSKESENKIIHGDNLEALKSLLPEYEGKIDCIYIDPPYNTGNTIDKGGWAYNDNVSDPKIEKWLGEVVGQEGEDLTRHDKWLCMMYPRLRLLQKLLSEKGCLVISISYQELNNLVLLLKEMFATWQIVTVTVQTSGGKPSKGFTYTQEYLVFVVPEDFMPNVSEDAMNEYASPYHGMNLATFTKTERPNQAYPIFVNKETGVLVGVGKSLQQLIDEGLYTGEKEAFVYDYSIAPEGTVAIYPVTTKGDDCVWRLIPERLLNDWKDGYIKIVPMNKKANQNLFTVQYLAEGVIQKIKNKELEVTRISDNPDIPTLDVADFKTGGVGIPTIWTDKNFYTAKGTDLIAEIFGDKRTFNYSKPLGLVQEILDRISKTDSIVLDSFAGSGTTAQAVLNLNKLDNGNRKFILIEMMDYAETITAERIKRVISGYSYTGSEEIEIYNKKLNINNISEVQTYIDDANSIITKNENKWTKISKPKLVDNCIKVIATKEYDTKKDGLGGDFSFYELGEPLLINNLLNEKVNTQTIREYIWFTETNSKFTESKADENKYFLGNSLGAAYWFYYEKEKATTLDIDFLSTIKGKYEQYIIYADICLIPQELLQKNNIIFKKIPRDIKKF